MNLFVHKNKKQHNQGVVSNYSNIFTVVEASVFSKSQFLKLLSMVLVLPVLYACSGGNDDLAEGGNQPTEPQVPKGWQLAWSDEFSGSSLSSSNWNIQTGDGSAEGIPGWGNNELQSYQAENVEVSGGNLIITARKEDVNSTAYTSGRINTKGKFDFKYGRAEARIQAAAGQGMWSAFWMLPTGSMYGTWAAGGEIDIMEVFSRDPNPFTQAAIHYGMAWPLNTYQYQKYENIDPADGFHLYAVEWDENQIRWFVDGNHYYTVNNNTYWNYYKDATTNAHVEGSAAAPFDQPFHLLLNLAVGGNLPGAPDDSALPSQLIVDYVRVYECNINSTTGVGCDGFMDYTDPSVIPPPPGNVFRAEYDLYVDAVGPLTFPRSEDVVGLSLGVWDAGGALALSEMTLESRGTVIDVNTSGGGNFNIFPTDLQRLTLFGMGSASDGANYAGELQFDLYIFAEETDAESAIQVKLDSGFPDLGFVELPIADLAHDQWSTITVQISDIAHNPGSFGGGPVNLSEVLSVFVLETTGRAHLQVDNIKLTCAHVNADDCGIRPPVPPPPPSTEPFPVFIDSVGEAWDRGVGASDSGTGWTDYFEGNNSNKVQWQEMASDDAARGRVIEVNFGGGSEFGVWFVQASMGVDLGSYATGMVSFDIKVDDYGANEQGMTMKVDCFFPCTSGDQQIGKVGDGAWETVQIPVSRLLGGGLNLSSINTGIVVFPTSQTSPLRFEIDNIQWLSGDPPEPTMVGGGAITIYDESVAEGWFLWDCCGGAIFAEVDDDADHGKVVELAFGPVGTVTGFQANEGVDVSGIQSGYLEFEFKEVSPPPDGSQWRLKLESSGAATFVEVLLTDAGNPIPSSEWQTYRFSLDETLAALDKSDVKLVMIFPDWANADGAVGRIDNVRIAPESAPIELYGNALADGWYLWDCCGAATFAEV
ncbi:MAG: family 16 glycosylhydrolase, partial [Gammaproteobacteria bacterium]|nr:family 16 glycosylhydrolase [Gammaproteobacteria bacterium]